MLAAVLVKSKSKLELMDIEIPTLAYGQVLVKLKYSGICGAQINEIDAVKGKDKFLPHLLGHEGTGIVESTGEVLPLLKKVIMLYSIGKKVMALSLKHQNINLMEKLLMLVG